MNQLIVSELMDIQCIRVGKCCGKYIKIKENRNEGLGIHVLTMFSIFRGSSYSTAMFGQTMRELIEDISGGIAGTEGLGAEECKSWLRILKGGSLELKHRTRKMISKEMWPGPWMAWLWWLRLVIDLFLEEMIGFTFGSLRLQCGKD